MTASEPDPTPFIEEVFDHEPRDATLEMKAAVTVVVRNSLLEVAHTNGPLGAGGIQAITTARAGQRTCETRWPARSVIPPCRSAIGLPTLRPLWT